MSQENANKQEAKSARTRLTILDATSEVVAPKVSPT